MRLQDRSIKKQTNAGEEVQQEFVITDENGEKECFKVTCR